MGLNDTYRLQRMQSLVLHPAYTGEAYEWRLDGVAVSALRDFVFCAAEAGTYSLEFRLIDKDNPLTHAMTMVVLEEEVAYSPYIAAVYEYCPAPGQFVNVLPEYVAGDTGKDMCRKAEELIAANAGGLVSLGGFGGYLVFGFDHSVVNVPGERDFRILGNAFYAAGSSSFGSSEPGIVSVSIDCNGNGLPDDVWYELAGSEYYKPETLHNYGILYTDRHEVVVWEDNRGVKDTLRRNAFHKQPYFPQWVAASELSFSGTLLASHTVMSGTDYRQRMLDYGYADNRPNDDAEGTAFDLAWAVDDHGTPVSLPCADFVRVCTGVNEVCGWTGELSTEVQGAVDLHIQ